MFGGAAYGRVVKGQMDVWSVVSKCYTTSLLEDSGASAGTHFTQRHCLCIAVHFLKKTKPHCYGWLQIIWKCKAGIRFRCSVWFLSPYHVPCTCCWYLRAGVAHTFWWLEIPVAQKGAVHFPLLPQLRATRTCIIPCPSAHVHAAVGWAGQSAGLADDFGKQSTLQKGFSQQFLALAHFSHQGFWWKYGSSSLWWGTRAVDSLRIYFWKHQQAVPRLEKQDSTAVCQRQLKGWIT